MSLIQSGTCSVCGCSEDDPCPGGCIWANGSATLCSRCVDAEGPLVDLSDDADDELSIWDGCDEVPLEQLEACMGDEFPVE